MKIAIKANPSRGKEIISLLESLGGINSTLEGNGEFYTYYIDEHNVIRYHDAPTNYKVYTLEEFEKEFPFKVGDEVIIPDYSNKKGTIVSIEPCGPILSYFIKLETGNGIYRSTKSIKLYKEMKEERNITLTLDKAKEWYKKGGELREIALQAFTEEELNPLPRSWEEYCRKYEYTCLSTRYTNISLKYDALLKLEQLRDCWRQGWKPNWLDDTMNYVIKGWRDTYSIENVRVTHEFLSFPTYEMAKEFLKCFKDLIEKTGDLI